MDQILAQGLWAVRGIYGVLYTIRVENATAIFRTAWLFYGRRGGFFRTAGLFFSARGSVRSQVLPLEGKVSPQATEEVSYRKAVRSDGRENGTSSTQSFPLRGRCRRWRRKRCRTGSQFVSTDAKAERRSPLPSSGLRETPESIRGRFSD